MGKNVIISTLPNISQNYLPKVNTSNIFANSLVYDDGSSVLINTTTASAFRLDVNGTGRFQGELTGTSATFTLANDITLTARSGAAGSYTYWSLGRTSSELELGVAAAANQFFTGTAAGDVIIKANGSSNKLMFGYGSGSPTLTLASTGAATFSSSVTADIYNSTRTSAYLLRDGSVAGYGIYKNSATEIGIAANGSVALNISSTGAATFSSSVTASYYDGTVFRVFTSSTFRGGLGTGSWAFGDGTNDVALTSDTATKIGAGGAERMRITSGGNVGIGTTSPLNKLHIDGSSGIRVSDATGANFRGITFGATAADSAEYSYIKWQPNSGEFRIYANTAGFGGFMSFYSNNSEAMRITSGGDVGIGASSPVSIANYKTLTIQNTNGALIELWHGTGRGLQVTATTTEAYLYTGTSMPLLFYTNGSERMRITSEGYLGTTVTGTTVSAGDLLGVLAFVSRDSSTYSSGGIANIRSYATTTYNTGNVSGDLRFYVSSGLQNTTGSYLFGTEAMRITSWGDVWVSRTSVNVNDARLASYQGYNVDTNSTALAFQRTAGYFDISAGDNSNNQGSYSSIVARTLTGQATNKGALLRGYSNTWNGSAYEDIFMVQINWNGNITNVNGSYGTILSDSRFKENIIPATSKLSDLSKLNVVNFNFIGNEEKHIGFIAQEMGQVFPSLVYKTDTRKYDDEGNVIGGYEDTLGLKVGMEFAILVKAIQELKAENDQQKADIESLKALINK